MEVVKITHDKLILVSVNENTEEQRIETDNRENKGLYKASMKIAMKIKRALRETNMTQTVLAAKMGIDPAVLSRLLNGKANMELKTMVKFEEVLGISIIDRTISPHSKDESARFEANVYTFALPVSRSYEIREELPSIVSEPSYPGLSYNLSR